MLVYVVQPVAILSAVFCVICSSLLVFVSSVSGGHMVKNVLKCGSCYGFVCCNYRFPLFPTCC